MMANINKNNHQLKRKREYNIGIGILRTCLSFMVIMDHLYNQKIYKKYVYFFYYHIPTFFLLSFFYTFNTLSSFNINKIQARFERIMIPYFSWCFIYWIFNLIYFYILNKECRHSLIDFLKNLVNGHVFNVALWFQNILIQITIIFEIAILIFKNNHIYILVSLGILAYIFQYTGWNYNLFRKYSSFHFKLTFGRFAEGIPNAVSGFYIASKNYITLLKSNSKIAIINSFIIVSFITKFNVFSEIETYKYGGVRLNIAAICFFFIFYLFPFRTIKNKFLINIITQITSYTGGIYFIHNLIGRGYILKKFLSILAIKRHTLFECIIVFFISYIICFSGTKICGRTKFRHLFS
jgi:fucose 4-O-acetylase-like acetyltransferase